MMTRLIAVLSALFLVACASTPQVDYNPSFKFDDVKTYAWVPHDETAEQPEDLTGILDSGLTQSRIIAAVDRNLSTLGWERVSVEQADVLVTFHLRLDTRRETVSRSMTTHPYGWSHYGGPYYYRGYGYGYSERRETEYDVGTILIDMLEPMAGEDPALIWRAVRDGRLRQLSTIEKREEAINDTVDFLFSTFPPGSAQE